MTITSLLTLFVDIRKFYGYLTSHIQRHTNIFYMLFADEISIILEIVKL